MWEVHNLYGTRDLLLRYIPTIHRVALHNPNFTFSDARRVASWCHVHLAMTRETLYSCLALNPILENMASLKVPSKRWNLAPSYMYQQLISLNWLQICEMSLMGLLTSVHMSYSTIAPQGSSAVSLFVLIRLSP